MSAFSTDGQAPAVPKRAADRPFYKGLLVPFTVKWFDGVPDFKVTDPKKLRRCLRERRCGLCGKKMDAEVVFIAGPISLANRLFNDPAMHEACARYAYAVCPFMRGDIQHMATTYRPGETTDEHISPERPDRFGLLFTDGWNLTRYRESVYIHASQGRIEWL